MIPVASSGDPVEMKAAPSRQLSRRQMPMPDPPISISFNRPSIMGRELEYMREVIDSGKTAGDQKFSRLCQGFLEQTLGVKRALLTTSCTHALEMSALLLNIQPGDEVVVPSFTFVSTVNAFVLRGATPVFCDIRPDTLNLDESLLPDRITGRTKAIVPVHYAGVGCEMDEITRIADGASIAVVEDNAHGLFGKYKGRWLGTMGCLAAQSFHETKNIACGEGGALLINDESLIDRAEIIREKGTNRSRFFRGQVDKYSWVDLGSSYVISDLLGAFLYGQMEVWQRIQARRAQIWRSYDDGLAAWCAANGVGRPQVPAHCEQPWHMYYMLMPSAESRRRLIGHLRAHGILAVFHYLPLHLSEFGVRYGGKPGDCPVTEDVSERLVRLPFYCSLKDEEQSRVIDLICSLSL